MKWIAIVCIGFCLGCTSTKIEHPPMETWRDYALALRENASRVEDAVLESAASKSPRFWQSMGAAAVGAGVPQAVAGAMVVVIPWLVRTRINRKRAKGNGNDETGD